MKAMKVIFIFLFLMSVALTAWVMELYTSFDVDFDGYSFSITGWTWADYTFDYTVWITNKDTGEVLVYTGTDVVEAGDKYENGNFSISDEVVGDWDLPYGEFSVTAEYEMHTLKEGVNENYEPFEGSFGPIDLSNPAPVVHKNPIFRSIFSFILRILRRWCFRWY